jgi:hypothetical protein
MELCLVTARKYRLVMRSALWQPAILPGETSWCLPEHEILNQPQFFGTKETPQQDQFGEAADFLQALCSKSLHSGLQPWQGLDFRGQIAEPEWHCGDYNTLSAPPQLPALPVAEEKYGQNSVPVAPGCSLS